MPTTRRDWTQIAADTAGPVRVLVVPADALRESDPSDPDAAYGNDIAYADDELPGQLYDRVGVDGTYAVLVDADSSFEGRSFSAYQFSEERPFYEVEGAVDHAVELLRARLRVDARTVSSTTPTTSRPTRGPSSAGWPAGSRRWSRWSSADPPAPPPAAAQGRGRPGRGRAAPLAAGGGRRAVQTVAALPPAPAGGGPGDELNNRTRQVLDLVEEARHRLDVDDGQARMDTPDEVEDVVRRLADARYELAAIDALRDGRPVPEQTAPCFFDPRHGPSVDERPFTPEGGPERRCRCARSAPRRSTPAGSPRCGPSA